MAHTHENRRRVATNLLTSLFLPVIKETVFNLRTWPWLNAFVITIILSVSFCFVVLAMSQKRDEVRGIRVEPILADLLCCKRCLGKSAFHRRNENLARSGGNFFQSKHPEYMT